MRQILQSLKTGETSVTRVPVPACSPDEVLVQTTCSLISSGTEKMLVDFGNANLLSKARQQPDKVRMVLDKVKADGLKPTIETVLNKLDQPLPLGYCNVGRVIEVGRNVRGLSIGDRVASNGKHADVVAVPQNLCAKVPDGVSDECAAFTVLSAIALQGIRLANPTLGETVVVTGLGLVGLLTVQLLLANGCRVLGVDIDTSKVDLAKNLGADAVNLSEGEDLLSVADRYSRGRGVDAVIITASTKSSDPVHEAALMSRKRGRIILVGVTGLELRRADFYEKELTFQVSCSYGPGRYDPSYEERGIDYPIGFVRWTEQRNFEAVLDVMSGGRLDVGPLVTHRFSIDDGQRAYELLQGSEPSLGIILVYDNGGSAAGSRQVNVEGLPRSIKKGDAKPRLSFIGSGNYASSILIPAFKTTGVSLGMISCREGVSGVHSGGKFGFENVTTDSHAVASDQETDAVVITTRHDTHAEYVCSALRSGKHVFVEKPLCLTTDELEQISATYAALDQKPVLTVGFNRRFAPQVKKLKALLQNSLAPKALTLTVNAGPVPKEHWIHDPLVGGGRLIGEVCHFIDLMRFLLGASIQNFGKVTLDSASDDTFSIVLSFSDGSVGTINYFANGPRSIAKERLEIFSEGSHLFLDNFRKLRGTNWTGFKKFDLPSQDKGQRACAQAFVDAINGGTEVPIPVDEIFEVTRVSLALAERQ